MAVARRANRQVGTAALPGARGTAAETDLSTGVGLERARAEKLGSVASVTGHEGWPGMIRVFAALDPHYIRAQVGEQTGAEGAGEHVGEIQHAIPGQRSGWSGFGGCLHGVILS